MEIENRDKLVNDMGLASSQTFIPTDHLLDPRVDWTIARDIQFRTYLRGAVYDPEKTDYWPLPQSQIQLQKKELQQDPSYH